MSSIENLPTVQVSPFDALRRVRDDGSEYWSARDLMPHMEYGKWDKFEPVIVRAICAAENMGIDVSANFLLAEKVSGKRGPKQQDVQCSRYGAYLVAINGDPSKPTVAAMQTYFAVRTRQAEVQPRALTEDEIVHQALAITARRVGELEAKVGVRRQLAVAVQGTQEALS